MVPSCKHMKRLIILLLSATTCVAAPSFSTNVGGIKLSPWTTTTNPVTAMTALAAGYSGGYTGLFEGTFYGDGQYLTNLDSGFIYWEATDYDLAGGNFTNFTGNGVGLTNVNASQLGGVWTGATNGTSTGSAWLGPLGKSEGGVGTLNYDVGLNRWWLDSTAVFDAGSFNGDGGGMTNLDADNLSIGTVANARLPVNVVTNNGSVTFSGSLCVTGANYLALSNGTVKVLMTNGNVTASGTIGGQTISAVGTASGYGVGSGAGGTYTVSSGSLYWSGRSKMTSPADGQIRFASSSEAGADLFAGTLTASNGVYYWVGQTNTGVYTNVWQPKHCWASMMLIGDETVDLVTQSAYVQVTNFDGCFTNGMTCVPTNGVITNLTAGFYQISISGSGLGTTANSQLYEGSIYTNNVECTLIEWQRSVSSVARGSWVADGVLYLPANTRIDTRIKSDAASPDDITLGRYTVTVRSM